MSFQVPEKLGVGVSYQPGLEQAFAENSHLIDYIEVSPDTLCRETQTPQGMRMRFNPNLLSKMLNFGQHWPVVVHGLGLSIGTSGWWNQDYIRLLDEFSKISPFSWHSEHLGFLQAKKHEGALVHSGVILPLPLTREALDTVIPRARWMQNNFGKPFILENITHYFKDMPADDGVDEIEFLNLFTTESDCGLLLDLYNFYCNAKNFGFDAKTALKKLRLDRVVEIHVAGGSTHDSLLLDMHSDVVPEPVWELLDWVVDYTPNLCGIVYELLDQAWVNVGPDRYRQQLEKTQALWQKHLNAESEVCYAAV